MKAKMLNKFLISSHSSHRSESLRAARSLEKRVLASISQGSKTKGLTLCSENIILHQGLPALKGRIYNAAAVRGDYVALSMTFAL